MSLQVVISVQPVVHIKKITQVQKSRNDKSISQAGKNYDLKGINEGMSQMPFGCPENTRR